MPHLVVELTRVLAEGLGQSVASLAAQPSSEILPRLSAILAADPRLNDDLGLNLRGSSKIVSPTTLAFMCLDRSISHGAGEAAAWVDRILSAKEIEVVTIHLLSGVKCDSLIALNSQLSFVPLETLSLSQDEFSFVQPAVDRSKSTQLAFLQSSVRVGPPLTPLQTSGDLAFVPPLPGLVSADQRAQLVLEMLPLIGPSNPRNEATWTRVVDPDFQPLASLSTHLVDGAAPLAPVAVIDSTVGALFHRYEGMNQLNRVRLAGLIAQLADATAASSSGSRAVRLCTLLEATFCSPNQRKRRQEIVNNALTALLGSVILNDAARLQIRTAFNVRNSMVHEGAASVTSAEQADIWEALQIARAGLTEIVNRGHF